MGLNYKRVLVTGGAGMCGSTLTRKLIERGHEVVVVDNLTRGRREWVDPRAKFIFADCRDWEWSAELGGWKPEYIFHMAAMIGGVKRMIEEAFYSAQNAASDWNVFEYASRVGAGMLYMGTACCHPVQIQTKEFAGKKCLLKEDAIFSNGANPESLYGWAKTLGLQTAMSFRKQFRLPTAIVVAYNMYGPGELAPIQTAHVIPALVQKALRGDNPLEVWGDGTAERAFTFVEDAADGIILAAEKLEDAEMVNIGTPEIVTIRELADKVISIVNPAAKIRFDMTKPTGVHVRGADVTRAKQLLGWEPSTPLDIGLRRTVDWIRKQLGV